MNNIKKDYYILVNAQIVYLDDNEQPQIHSVQFLNKSPVQYISSMHLHNLQGLAAQKCKNELGVENLTFLSIIVLNILPLGQMTEEEFWGPDGDPNNRKESTPEKKQIVTNMDPLRH